MSLPAAESNTHTLRRDAETRLKGGTAPATQGWSTGATALSLLHSLASAPSTASDALKLLHELQVHQVELDLQHEQLELERHELEEALSRYTELFDYSPLALLTVNGSNHIVDANSAAARLFDADMDELQGRPLTSVLATDSRQTVPELLSAVRSSGQCQRGQVLVGKGAGATWFPVLVSMLPHHQTCLVTLLDDTDADTRPLQA